MCSVGMPSVMVYLRADSLPVKDYFHWSLLDNFEWQKGYAMTFGLVAVDRQNGQKRTPNPRLTYLRSRQG